MLNDTFININSINNNSVLGSDRISEYNNMIEFDLATLLRRGFHVDASTKLSDLITDLDWEI